MSKKKFILLTLFMCILLIVFLPVYENQAAATDTAPLTTLRLTDRENTFYWAAKPIVLAGSFGAHVIWSENVDSLDDSDLFYAQLPAGTVTRLSDRTATVGKVGNYDSLQAALDSSDRLYVVWAEDVGGDEWEDVFFWKTGMNTPINISDHAMSNGDVGNLMLVLDANEQAHALWAEGTITSIFGPSIFYWSEASGITRKLSTGTGTVGEFNVTQAMALAVHGNTVHAVWQDLDPAFTGSVQPFYWNSDTDTVTPIRGDGAITSESYFRYYHLDNNNVFHMLWHDQYTDYFYWDSASGNNIQFPNVALPEPTSAFIPDGNGNAHLYYETSGVVYQWDTVNKTATQIPELTAMTNVVDSAAGQSGDHFHLIWQATDSDFPSHMSDLFYWRSDMTEPINMTDHTAAPANPANVEMVVDETDTVHVLWEETALLYYNSSSNITTQLPAVLTGLTMEQVVSRGGVAYAQFVDSYAAMPPFYIWQSDTNNATPAAGTSRQGMLIDDDSASANSIWLDSNDMLHIAFEHGATFNHWDEMRGIQDLTADPEMEPVDSNGEFFAVADSAGGSYLVWQGETPVDDGVDMYAAFVMLTWPHSVYLPLIVR